MEKFFGKIGIWIGNVVEWIASIIIIGICIGLFLMLFSFGIAGMYLMLKYVHEFWSNIIYTL